jgi:hypothetical protein
MYAAPSPLFQLKPRYTRSPARCSPPARFGAGTAWDRVGSSPGDVAWAAAAQSSAAPPLRYPPGTPPSRAPRGRRRWCPDPHGEPRRRAAPPGPTGPPGRSPQASDGLWPRQGSPDPPRLLHKYRSCGEIFVNKLFMTVKLSRVPSWILKTFI